MPLVLNGDGSIQSLVPGGLPDATITQADLDTATSFAPPAGAFAAVTSYWFALGY